MTRQVEQTRKINGAKYSTFPFHSINQLASKAPTRNLALIGIDLAHSNKITAAQDIPCLESNECLNTPLDVHAPAYQTCAILTLDSLARNGFHFKQGILSFINTKNEKRLDRITRRGFFSGTFCSFTQFANLGRYLPVVSWLPAPGANPLADFLFDS